ncbi:MAG TPA: LLM class flavin-dependent oxidoreductase [Herpetosiphonaceae bacterium]|nr:LLM class flavin-dependent oxidoreductase [Herpetosiphonaceae bacterium]
MANEPHEMDGIRRGGAIPFSVLDLATIFEGSDASHALANTRELARHAEALGFERFWLAEHHNMPSVASAATAVVVGAAAAATSSIRVGSGGVMLPNHAPLVIAEQFGTLAALHPGRIDLGLGRAPGTDLRTARALRRDAQGAPGLGADRFPDDVLELQAYFAEPAPGQALRAIPGAGLEVPIWLLGSSTYSAQLAAALGLPFAFASHFAPAQLMQALQIYRSRFQPSAHLARPYAMVAANVVAADSDEEAERLFSSIQQAFLRMQRGEPAPIPPPLEDPKRRRALRELVAGSGMLDFAVAGSPETVRRGLESILARTAADEIMITAHIYDRAARLRSFELVAAARDAINADRAAAKTA